MRGFCFASAMCNSMAGVIHGVHDPSRAVLSRDGAWHIFSSHNGIQTAVGKADHGNFPTVWTQGEPVFHALPQWLREKVPAAAADDFWAPDLLHSPAANEWRLYYSASGFGSQISCIGMAKSADPAGPFVDAGEVFCSKHGDAFNAIDPCPLVASGGGHWLSFGSFWQGIYIIELDAYTGKAIGAPHGPVARNVELKPNSIEASYLHEWDGQFYLFVNWGQCCKGTESTYQIFVGRSHVATGPFVDKDGRDLVQGGGTLLLDTHSKDASNEVGPGHVGIARTSNGNQFLTYHFYDAADSGTPALGIRPLRFVNGWPTLAGPHVAATAKNFLV